MVGSVVLTGVEHEKNSVEPASTSPETSPSNTGAPARSEQRTPTYIQNLGASETSL